MPDTQRTIPRAPRTPRSAVLAGVLLAFAGAALAAAVGGTAGGAGGALLGVGGVALALAGLGREARRFEAQTRERAEAAAVELEERRRAETRLRADLRTHEAARKESEERRRVAESADRAKTAFLSNLSRELRTPLNNVLGLAGILLDTHLSDRQVDYVRTIHGSAEALIAVVDDILDLSRLDDDDLQLDRREFEFDYCVESVVDTCTARAREREIDLRVDLDPSIPSWLVGDRRRLRQVLLALLGRAVEHSVASRLHVSARLEEGEPADEAVVRFEIFAEADGGPPPPPPPEDDPGSAYAVGLSLAGRLVQQMGGELTLDPAGVRASFSARLGHSLRAERHRDESTHPELAGKRMLLISADEDCAAAATGTGRSFGMEVETATTGTEGLDRLGRYAEEGIAPPVVAIDAELPDVSGRELIAIMRHMQDVRVAGCILLRSPGAHERPDELARMGFDAWIRKPISVTRLRTAVLHVTADLERGERPSRPSRPTGHGESHPPPPRLDADVLLAEDNLVNQKVMSLLLEQLGCRVESALSGMQAIEKVMERDFDVVLMDCLMPELNGYDATRAIRKLTDPVKCQIPIIALTASASEEDRRACLAAGMNSHLAKPVRTSDLAHALQHWAGSQGPSTTEPKMTDPGRPIDPDVLATLKELGEEDPSIFTELVELFLTDTPERMRGLEQAQAQGDAKAIEASAHALKSSCGNLGAMGLYEMFRDIEARGRQGDVEGVESLIHEVREEFGRVEEALRRETA